MTRGALLLWCRRGLAPTTLLSAPHAPKIKTFGPHARVEFACVASGLERGEKNALQEVNVVGMTVSEVQGYGRQRGYTETCRGAEYQIEFAPRAKIEVIIPDDIEEFVVSAITRTARSGKLGDGKIFVNTLDDVVRIRTGERGEAAL